MTTTLATCLECGTTFPRREAATAAGTDFACPTCGSGAVRGVPAPRTSHSAPDTTRCTACGATFNRGDATTEVKGELACPECGARDGLEPIDPDDRAA